VDKPYDGRIKMLIKIGDIVTRKSYNNDLIFRVIQIQEDKSGEEKTVILHGEDMRLVADSPINDLITIDEREYSKRKEVETEKENRSFKLFRQDYQLLRQKTEYQSSNGYNYDYRSFQLPGKVLHLDGDASFLQKCKTVYERLGVPIYGVHISEKEMPNRVGSLIQQVRPDILVITGHDAYSKTKGKINDLKAYRNSRYFAQTVIEARKVVPNLDQLVIFAGACQSNFETLIRAGANFASSPTRINIHALDPVYIVAKLSFTPFNDQINVWDVIRNTLTGEKGLGGIETRGLLRNGIPYQEHKE
jgi:spore coat assembly protein